MLQCSRSRSRSHGHSVDQSRGGDEQHRRRTTVCSPPASQPVEASASASSCPSGSLSQLLLEALSPSPSADPLEIPFCTSIPSSFFLSHELGCQQIPAAILHHQSTTPFLPSFLQVSLLIRTGGRDQVHRSLFRRTRPHLTARQHERTSTSPAPQSATLCWRPLGSPA